MALQGRPKKYCCINTLKMSLWSLFGTGRGNNVFYIQADIWVSYILEITNSGVALDLLCSLDIGVPLDIHRNVIFIIFFYGNEFSQKLLFVSLL